VKPGFAAALACLLGFAADCCLAATFHVRADGGDPDRCDGRSDQPAPAGATSRQACAWSHPFHALPPGGEPRIGGGDTLRIAPGDYRMGLGAPGSERCHRDFSWDCHMPPLPSGSAGAPTRLTGAGADGRCATRPELWGAERASMVINLQGSSHVEVSCLEITDRAACVENHCHGGACGGPVKRCPRDTPPYGDWSGTGIAARDAAHVELRELDIHGLALRGVHAGRLRDWHVADVAIRGNGWSGWDGDLGQGDSGNQGTLRFERVEIAWNGCVEDWPGEGQGSCWGQQAGGYGDGLGTAATGGHWIFEDVDVHHNASDGLDLLHLRSGGTVQVRRGRLHGNAGNQFKASARVLLEDSRINGNCAALGAYGLAAGDRCRAGGTAVAVNAAAAGRAVLLRNRLEGEGDCLVVVEEGSEDSRIVLHGNELLGGPLWDGSGRLTCGFYAHRSQGSPALSDNRFAGVRDQQCPDGNRCED
jgi:hypothetical protein